MFGWFKMSKGQKPPVRNPQQPKEAIDPMVGEPVISFVKCLNNNPKRFKLSFHSYAYAVETGLWGEIYHWMSKDNSYTGFAKLRDRQKGDVYYGIVHKGELYSITGISFSLNHWEKRYIKKAFDGFRSKATERKSKMRERAIKLWYEEKDKAEKIERLKLMEKFQ